MELNSSKQMLDIAINLRHNFNPENDIQVVKAISHQLSSIKSSFSQSFDMAQESLEGIYNFIRMEACSQEGAC